MAEFLSAEWVASLDLAARSSASLAACAREGTFVVEQRVAMPDGSERAHHLVLATSGARVESGRAVRPDLVLETDLTTARDLALGRANAQDALASARLRVGGAVETLADRGDALRALDDVFASVRSATTYPVDAGPTVASAG